MSQVVLANLEKIYPEKTGSGVRAVKGISLTVEDGEFMVFVGPSGCGKSTTLRMIAGLEELSGGTIEIDEILVNALPPKDRDIAMVFQNYALYPHMSVFENMAFGLRLRKMPKTDIDLRVREVAAMLNLTEYLDRKPKSLSGGQRQRVAVGRAIVRKPKVFLFDEPLSNLDAKMRVSMRSEISKLHDQLKATMIYVTHDQVEAMTMGDRICVMKDGNIMQLAKPLDLYNHPANVFVAGFIGSPSMNFFRGKIKQTETGATFIEEQLGGAGIRVRLASRLAQKIETHAGRDLILGIRPEDISESSATGGPALSQDSIEAAIDMVETMGAETYLYLKIALTSFVARLRPCDRFAVGQKITVCFDMAKVHLFDAETEQAL